MTGTGQSNGTGNAVDNVITGNSGNNVLAGLGGADTLDRRRGHRHGELCGLAGGRQCQPDARASAAAATPRRHARQYREPDRLGQDDTLEGNAGNNVLAGGAGIDTVTLRTRRRGRHGQPGADDGQNTSGAGSDTLSGFENLTGSAFNDTLTGNALPT